MAIANEISEISDDYAVQPAIPKKDNLLLAASRKRQNICVFKYLPQIFDIIMSLMSLLPSSYKKVEKMIRSEF